MKICFLVGGVTISGGTSVILHHADYLRRLRHSVTLAVKSPFRRKDLSWHDGATALRIVTYAEALSEQYDLVIATWWETALDLPRFTANQYAYFVQSIESRFYDRPKAALRALIESTYHLPVHFVTEASWIQRFLAEHHRKDAPVIRNGIRKDLFCTEGGRVSERPSSGEVRFLVEGPLGIFFKNTAFALRLARRARVTDLWLLTSSPITYAPGVTRIFSGVPIAQTPAIYRSCDVLIKLSTVEGMFGPPLEMFHCGGTAVVLNVSGADEYIVNGHNAVVIPHVSPQGHSAQDTAVIAEGVISAIENLRDNPCQLRSLKEGAIQTARGWPSWAVSSALFAGWAEGIAQAPLVDREELQRTVRASAAEYQQQCRDGHTTGGIRERTRGTLRYLAAMSPAALVERVKSLEYSLETIFGGHRIG